MFRRKLECHEVLNTNCEIIKDKGQGIIIFVINFAACKDIALAVITGKTKYMQIGRHRGMIANEHIRI